MEGHGNTQVRSALLDADEIDDLVETLHDAAHTLSHLTAAGTCCAEAGRPLEELWWDLQLAADHLENRAE